MTSDTPLQAGREGAAQLPVLPAGPGMHRLLFDGLPGMAYLARTDRARTVEIASAGSHLLLGFKPDRRPFPLTPLIHPDDLDSVLEVIKSAVADNHPFAVEYRLRHADGGWRTVWEQGRPFRRGPSFAVSGQLVDVTQRLQHERARLNTELRLLHAQKFIALNHLAAGVAHEFNNLIAGILGSAELLAMDLPDSHPGRETLKQIFEASNHARDFVHKLREVGQRPTPEFKPIRLQPVIEECLQILRTIIPARIELQVRIDPDCPKVNADAAQIHQVIMDLCLHSWQGLAERRGHIQIALDCLPEGRSAASPHLLPQPGPYVCLSIQDDGPGFEKHALENLFHPYRLRRSSGKKVGLELFLVREIIQAHQGEIFSEVQAAPGLTFRIYLPALAEKPPLAS